MTQFDRVHRHDTTLAQVASPILIGILVIYAVLQIVRKKVLQFNRRSEFQRDPWQLPVRRVSQGTDSEQDILDLEEMSPASAKAHAWKRNDASF